MRTALASNDDYDEVPVSSIEVLDANLTAIREGLMEFKTEVRAALTNINGEIKSLREHVGDEIKSLRERGDRNFERLHARIDATNQEVSQLSKAVTRTDSKLKAMAWIWGGLGGVAGVTGLIATLAKVFHWF